MHLIFILLVHTLLSTKPKPSCRAKTPERSQKNSETLWLIKKRNALFVKMEKQDNTALS